MKVSVSNPLFSMKQFFIRLIYFVFIVCHCFSVNFWVLPAPPHPQPPHTTMDLSSATIATTTPVCLVCFCFVFFSFDIPSWLCAHGPKTLRMKKKKRVNKAAVAISFIQDLSFYCLFVIVFGHFLYIYIYYAFCFSMLWFKDFLLDFLFLFVFRHQLSTQKR